MNVAAFVLGQRLAFTIAEATAGVPLPQSAVRHRAVHLSSALWFVTWPDLSQPTLLSFDGPVGLVGAPQRCRASLLTHQEEFRPGPYWNHQVTDYIASCAAMAPWRLAVGPLRRMLPSEIYLDHQKLMAAWEKPDDV